MRNVPLEAAHFAAAVIMFVITIRQETADK